MALIEICNLTTVIGGKTVHKDLSFSVEKGEILGIVGGSGSGKSVLLRVILGLIPPKKGKILFEDQGPWGVQFQNGGLLSSLTVLENVMIPLRELLKLPYDFALKCAFMKLKMVGLKAEDGYKLPEELSGGMVKRAALARAIAADPQVLFLDEPTAGLDPIAANDYDEMILKLRKDLSLTVVMISHDLDSLYRITDRIAVLVDQQVIMGTFKEHQHNSHPWMQNYFCGPRARRLS